MPTGPGSQTKTFWLLKRMPLLLFSVFLVCIDVLVITLSV
ncbi:hypothetical protein DSUL_20055 [Desulfovibrionales bacterium]